MVMQRDKMISIRLKRMFKSVEKALYLGRVDACQNNRLGVGKNFRINCCS